jgi:phosphotransferase system enzyme I (PtsI)
MSMEIRKGIGVSPGYAIDEAFVLDTEQFIIPKRQIKLTEVKSEVARLHVAIEASQNEVVELQAEFSQAVGEETAQIFEAHIWMLQDRKIVDEIVHRIREEKVTTEYAVSRVFRRYVKIFTEMKNVYLQHRVSDVVDSETRLLRHLLGKRQQNLANLTKNVIIVAHDLTPSQTAMLNKDRVKGIVSDLGGPTSHSAIMAKALKIPCVVGLTDISTNISGGDTLAIDGNRGVVVISPVESILNKFRDRATKYYAFEKELESEQRELTATTVDGQEVELMLNIEDPEELKDAGAKGYSVGLFRTEYLYLTRGGPLDEDAHFEAYKRCLDLLDGRALVVRTMDLGGDKMHQSHSWKEGRESNPILGCRSIRLSFEQPAMFRIQIRALLRAAKHGEVKILFPLISSLTEIRRAKQFLKDVIEEMTAEGQDIPQSVPVGMMVEVPSSALLIDLFVDEADFFAIGSNDLVQYTLAVDRGNERVANLYRPSHPAVLRLINNVIDVCKKANKPVSLCGEIAGDLRFSELLLGMGLRSFSMLPAAIPEVKKIIRSVDAGEAEKLLAKILKMDDSENIYSILEKRAKVVLPFAF